jgi:hypothetical protein
MPSRPTRADDDAVLHVLALSGAGHSSFTIARMTGWAVQKVTQVLIHVRAQDIAHDPDAASFWATNHPKG